VIVSWLIEAVTQILAGIFSLLPSWSIPSWLASGTLSTGVANTIGGFLEPVRNVLPVDTICSVLASVLALWPAILGYLVFQWIWSHLPTIAGFGTGDGG
jgi:hypothetical protein